MANGKKCASGEYLKALNAVISALLRGDKISTHQQYSTQISPQLSVEANVTTTIEIENSNGNSSSVEKFTFNETNTKPNTNTCQCSASSSTQVSSDNGEANSKLNTSNTEAKSNPNAHNTVEGVVSNVSGLVAGEQSNNLAQRIPNGRFNCRGDGIQPDPEDDSKFYICDRGLPYHFDCPRSLRFDPKHNVCNWPHNVKCKSG